MMESIDVAAVYGEPYEQPEEYAALTPEEAVAVLAGAGADSTAT